ncbi:phenylalanine 4-monooxygenase [Oceanisphaera arctica]|uniref:Phenylalanine-4-hydroxylase n=1 Tax=Oceanisphaera arctica TaxID=641510 RepID=A0A2P5TIP8_9GAMM|nr:phenylalanine 4-monooxygenase [Oceanisphaera arctica]PPL14697.1 phenylalanine 4-monooxygenase [Oceanisphaera arctica]GHA06630.1 phenylalanine 4-monooxygenase [Oceanisphaera arctica]
MNATRYVARKPDSDGVIHYSGEENAIWHTLIERQLACVKGRACDEYMAGLARLAMPHDRIPQLDDINRVLEPATGWQVGRVPALISFDRFFELLANRRFPVATFIRSRQELDYLQEPDIFHELFGHCALLTNPAFARFTHTYGQLGRDASPKDRGFLARLYWFTVEFGLLNTPSGRRIYGGGILSSPGETRHVFESDMPEFRPFDILDVLRTPYRIDIMQPVYYVLDSIDDLFAIAEMDIMAEVQKARGLGLFAPTFPARQNAS